MWMQAVMMFKLHSSLAILHLNVKFVFLTFLFQQVGVARLSRSMHACTILSELLSHPLSLAGSPQCLQHLIIHLALGNLCFQNNSP